MPAPLLPLIAVGAVLYFALVDDKKTKKNGARAKNCVDAGMPAEFENALNRLLENTALPASQLIAAAMIAETHNFTLAAACLRDAAKSRSGPQSAPPGFDPANPATWPGALGIPGGTVVGPPAQTPGLPPGGVEDQPCPVDAHMSPAQRAQMDALIANPASTPSILQGAAQVALAAGFPLAAACLTAEAMRRSGGAPAQAPPGFDPLNPATWPGLLQQVPEVVPIPSGGQVPFTIRFGDRPYGLATYYTGQGARFRELEPINPQLGAFTSSVPPYPGWQVGEVIQLPAKWNAGSKPTPPVGL